MASAPTKCKAADSAARIVSDALARLEQAGVPVDLAIDKLITAASIASVAAFGSAHTATEFRQIADRIGGGSLGQLEPKNPTVHNPSTRH